MFWTVSLSIIRSFSLYAQQWYMSYSLWAGSGWNCSSILILLAAVCTVKNSWWWKEELSETCRVSFQDKFEKSVHLVGFIVRNLSQRTVTWMSNSANYTAILHCKWIQMVMTVLLVPTHCDHPLDLTPNTCCQLHISRPSAYAPIWIWTLSHPVGTGFLSTICSGTGLFG